MKKNRSCLIAPVFVMIILLSVFYACHLYPFGDKTLSWCDMNQQVIPFLMDFKDILSGKADMFLNMQNAGGMSFWGVFLFFLSSPFTFLVAFVDKADMYFFANILVLLKMMLSAFTASLYFKNKFSNLHILQNAAISVMYAFCGYTMFYYQNNVWLDIMYLFPILLLGLSKLIDEGKVLLYIISFSAIMAVNFYLSYMVSIFIVLSFGIYTYFITPKEKRRKNIFLLCISTLMVALITAVIWLPSLMQYLNSARTGSIISSLKTGGFFTRFDTTVSVILCTSAVFCGIILYLLFLKKLPQTAHYTFLIFILTLIPVFIEPINKMWHTGNYQAFPVRYGYITIFFGLILFAHIISYINHSTISIKSSNLAVIFVAMVCVSIVFVAGCIILEMDYNAVIAYTRTLWGNSQGFRLLIIFSLITTFAYFIIILLYKYKKLSKLVFSIFLCAVVVLEAIFNSSVYIASASRSIKNEIPIIDLSDKIKDNSLFRVKTDEKYFDVNLVGSLGYNTLNHYTSLTSQDFMYTMKKLGYSSYWMEVGSNGGTKLTDAILWNKYSVINTKKSNVDDKIIYSNEEYSIKQNKLSLPIGIIMQTENINDIKNIPLTDRFDIQQYIFESVFNSKEKLFVKYRPTWFNNLNYTLGDTHKLTLKDNMFNGVMIYSIPVSEKQTLYFDCFDKLSNNLIEPINSSFSIYVNGKLLQEEYPSQKQNGLVNLGTFENETVNIEIRLLKDVDAVSFGIAGLKDEVLENSLKKVKTINLEQNRNKITGTINSENDDDYLLIPITCNNGFTAFVNNNESAIVKVFDSMMAVKLCKGLNNISLTFIPKGFKIGSIISLLSIIVTAIFSLLSKHKKWEYKKICILETFASAVFIVLSILIFMSVYIFPIIIYYIK